MQTHLKITEHLDAKKLHVFYRSPAGAVGQRALIRDYFKMWMKNTTGILPADYVFITPKNAETMREAKVNQDILFAENIKKHYPSEEQVVKLRGKTPSLDGDLFLASVKISGKLFSTSFKPGLRLKLISN